MALLLLISLALPTAAQDHLRRVSWTQDGAIKSMGYDEFDNFCQALFDTQGIQAPEPKNEASVVSCSFSKVSPTPETLCQRTCTDEILVNEQTVSLSQKKYIQIQSKI